MRTLTQNCSEGEPKNSLQKNLVTHSFKKKAVVSLSGTDCAGSKSLETDPKKAPEIYMDMSISHKPEKKDNSNNLSGCSTGKNLLFINCEYESMISSLVRMDCGDIHGATVPLWGIILLKPQHICGWIELT